MKPGFLGLGSGFGGEDFGQLLGDSGEAKCGAVGAGFEQSRVADDADGDAGAADACVEDFAG